MNGLLILIGILGLAFIAIGLLDELETRRRSMALTDLERRIR